MNDEVEFWRTRALEAETSLQLVREQEAEVRGQIEILKVDHRHDLIMKDISVFHLDHMLKQSAFTVDTLYDTVQFLREISTLVDCDVLHDKDLFDTKFFSEIRKRMIMGQALARLDKMLLDNDVIASLWAQIVIALKLSEER